MELDLPGGSAIEVIDHLARGVAVGDYLPVIAITRENDLTTIRAALEIGAADVVRAPVDLLELQHRIVNQLRVAAVVAALAEINRSLCSQLRDRTPRRSWRQPASSHRKTES